MVRISLQLTEALVPRDDSVLCDAMNAALCSTRLIPSASMHAMQPLVVHLRRLLRPGVLPACDLAISLCLYRLLIERLGFEKTFLVTASIKSLSYFALIPLLPLVCNSRNPIHGYAQPQCLAPSKQLQGYKEHGPDPDPE